MKLRLSSDFVIDSDVEPYRREGLRIAMLGGPGCYDDQTRVLTIDGFKLFKDLTLKDKTATLNQETGTLEYQNPTALQDAEYHGKMVQFKSRMYNLLVTPDHKMYCRRRANKRFELKDAIYLLHYNTDGIELKRDANWVGNEQRFLFLPDVSRQNNVYPACNLPEMKVIEKVQMDDWLEFLGWWLSEGSLDDPYEIYVWNQNPQFLLEIEAVIRRMGFTPNANCEKVSFKSKQIYLILQQFGYDEDRFIPREIKNLSSRQLNILLLSLEKGDATFAKGIPRVYSTVSRRLAEDVAEVLLKTGFGATICKESRPSNPKWHVAYRVCILHNCKTPRITNRPTLIEYSGRVYCATVPNHVLLVERNGRLIWCGNSGKSWNNSLLAEQFLQQGGTVVIFQPRDEFFTLKEKFDILSVGGVHAKDMEFALTSPGIYAKAVVEDGISMIFYTSAIDDEDKLIQWVSRFISHILKLQEQHKRPLLLILEEGHEYVPRSASGHVAPPWIYNRMVKAFKDCFTQGRKLNIIAIISSQRPQELNFTVRQLANLTFYGKFGDQDIGYIDKECLKYVRQRGVKVDASQLLDLGLGEWLVISGKDTRTVKVTAIRMTHHGAETPRLEYVAPRPAEVKKTIDDLARTIALALEKEQDDASELEKAKRKIRDLETKLQELQGKANIKLSVKEMMEGNGDEALQSELARVKVELKAAKEGLEESVQTADLNGYSRGRAESEDDLKESKNQIEKLEDENKAFSKLKEALTEIIPHNTVPIASAGNETVELQKIITVIPLEPVKRIIPKITTVTVKGKILTVAQTGFFSEWHSMPELGQELLDKYSWTCSQQALSQNLATLVDQDILGVRHEKGDLLEYRLSANVTFAEVAK